MTTSRYPVVPIVLNPEAIGDPTQTPIVQLPVAPMPVFVIKGKDALAVEAVMAYRDLCADNGLAGQADEVTDALEEIREWQAAHPDLVKLPDHKHVPAGDA